MSLKDAVLEIADEMEKELKNCDNSQAHEEIARGYIKQLRRVCKASTDSVAKDSFAFNPEKGMFPYMEAKEAERKFKADVQHEERVGFAGILCVGGPNDNTTVEMDSKMVEGSTPIFCGGVYKRIGSQLIFQPELTEQFQRRQVQVKVGR